MKTNDVVDALFKVWSHASDEQKKSENQGDMKPYFIGLKAAVSIMSNELDLYEELEIHKEKYFQEREHARKEEN